MALELLICYDGKEELTNGDVRQKDQDVCEDAGAGKDYHVLESLRS